MKVYLWFLAFDKSWQQATARSEDAAGICESLTRGTVIGHGLIGSTSSICSETELDSVESCRKAVYLFDCVGCDGIYYRVCWDQEVIRLHGEEVNIGNSQSVSDWDGLIWVKIDDVIKLAHASEDGSLLDNTACCSLYCDFKIVHNERLKVRRVSPLNFGLVCSISINRPCTLKGIRRIEVDINIETKRIKESKCNWTWKFTSRSWELYPDFSSISSNKWS